MLHFYAPGLKGPPGAYSNRIVRLSVRLSVCLSIILSCLQSAIFKVLVMIQWPNLDCKSIYGFLTLHWHHMPLGVGLVQNVGLRDFWLCCRRGHTFFTNTCLVLYASLLYSTGFHQNSFMSLQYLLEYKNIHSCTSGIVTPLSVRVIQYTQYS